MCRKALPSLFERWEQSVWTGRDEQGFVCCSRNTVQGGSLSGSDNRFFSFHCYFLQVLHKESSISCFPYLLQSKGASAGREWTEQETLLLLEVSSWGKTEGQETKPCRVLHIKEDGCVGLVVLLRLRWMTTTSFCWRAVYSGKQCWDPAVGGTSGGVRCVHEAVCCCCGFGAGKRLQFSIEAVSLSLTIISTRALLLHR